VKTSFNLKNHLKKQAFYEGAQELMRPERKMMDCQKSFLDQGMSAHDAWQKCQDLYDKKGKTSSHLE
jgi:hypothetical protein